ncbi:pentatricopeptide repeat-containing protein At1g11900 [Sesamum indicum]|uniref:Pentatricopeptide repeat-containing protein At1g11900 n=1 Tax=Sesamum indicum TaxID=4182 RepID=A0A8M8VG06_SESIN|nr:pentatricopeptide repeat-containing protein At1g11900 [Sesamum indicum]
MDVFLVQGFVKHSPIRVSWVWPFSVLSNSIGSRLSLSTQVFVEETADEVLNQILAAGQDHSVSREEVCLSYIRNLCAAGNLLAAAKIPKNLRGKHIFLGPRAYDCLLEAADRKNDIDILSQVFKDLLVSCASVRFTSYLIVARALGKRNDPAMLLNFIRDVCEMDFPRIDVVLNRVIFALAKCGHVDNALFVFDHMKSLKCKPDLFTYNTVLAILGRLGRVDDMLREFTFMKTVDLVPDIVTYNTVLNSLRKMGRLDLFMVHFKEMSDRGVQPDALTFKALIESLGRSGNIEEALKVFDEMKYKQIRPSIHIYRALIFSLKRMGKMELALRFSTEMNKLFQDSVLPRDFQYENR